MYKFLISNRKYSNDLKKVATIGNFDGIHLGHLNLFKFINHNHPQDWKILISFDTLPHEYFASQNFKPRQTRISLLRDKINRLIGANIFDEVIILHFNSYLAKLSPNDFINKYLKPLQITQMVIGHDFRFGKDKLGTYLDLNLENIKTLEFEPVYSDNQRVSSSLIRALAKNQELAKIKEYLGSNIKFTSRIVYGNQLGRKYGVPTINLNLAKIHPIIWGIYVGYAYIDNIRYPAVISCGKNPTVLNSNIYKVEAHLLDIDLILYGKIATIEVLHFLRTEIKFSDLNSLFKQIYQDISDARHYFATHKFNTSANV